jgi:arylsulfatase A-like enzyme
VLWHHRRVGPTLLGCVLLLAGCTPDIAPLPNVLLVSIDSLRSDHLGSYGYERDTSPHLDRLAAEGARFTTALAPSPWTLPSHVTLLTGRHPAAHGVRNTDRRLGAAIPTLAEVLEGAGYQTAAFVSGPYLRSEYGYDRGFKLYDQSLAVVAPAASREGISSPQLIDAALGWLNAWREESSRSPFFLFLHLWDVHYDFMPPPPFDTLFDPGYSGTVDGRGIEGVGSNIPAPDLQHIIALYDGEIRFTDEELGRIFARLRAWNLLEDTLIVVTADHGEEFFEHGKIGHSTEIYEESLRIPLILSYPRRVRKGQIFEKQVRLMDIPETILGLAGIADDTIGMPDGAPLQSRDLSPWLRGDESAGGFPELIAFPENYVWIGSRTGVRTNSAKLIRHSGTKLHEVFDLERDPAEQSRWKGGDPPLGQKRAELLKHEEVWKAWVETESIEAPKLDIRGRLQAQLEALGYIKTEPSEPREESRSADHETGGKAVKVPPPGQEAGTTDG